jgi:hypothetical protein
VTEAPAMKLLVSFAFSVGELSEPPRSESIFSSISSPSSESGPGSAICAAPSDTSAILVRFASGEEPVIYLDISG